MNQENTNQDSREGTVYRNIPELYRDGKDARDSILENPEGSLLESAAHSRYALGLESPIEF